MIRAASATAPEAGTWPVFLCYRQIDGTEAAELVYKSLQGETLPYTPPGYVRPPQLDVYFDRTAPAIQDWTLVHRPSLKAARSFVVICSPGAYARLKDDWVHDEIDWWVSNRSYAPVLIDPVGDRRWIPPQIAERWPTAQSLPVIPSEWPTDPDKRSEVHARLRDRIIAGIQADDLGIVDDLRRRLIEEQSAAQSLKRQRRWLTLVSGLLLAVVTAMVILLVITVAQRRDAQSTRARAVANSLVYAANQELNTARDDELATLLAVQASLTDKNVLLPSAETVFHFLSQPMSHIMDARPDGPISLSAVTAQLAGGCKDGQAVCIWDLNTRSAQPRRLPTDGRPLLGLAFSMQEDTLAACTDPGTLYVWDLRRGGEVVIPATCPGHLKLAVLDDGSQVAVGGSDRFVSIWDTVARTQQRFEIGSTVVGIAFEADRHSVTVLDMEGNHYLWMDSRGVQKVEHLDESPLALSTDGETALVVQENPVFQGIFFVTACGRENGKYTICDRTVPLSERVLMGALSPRGRQFMAGADGPSLSVSNQTANGGFKLPLFGESAANAMAISEIAPGEATPWIAASARDVRVWAATDYRRLSAKALGQLSRPPTLDSGYAVYDPIETAAFSPATPTLAVNGGGDKVYVHDLRRLADAPVELLPPDEKRPLQDDQGNTLSRVWMILAWSEDGKSIAGYRADGQIVVWAPSKGSRPIQRITLGERPLYKALSSSQIAFQSGRDNKIHIDAWGGRQQKRTLEPPRMMTALAWSDDNRTLLAGSARGSVVAWIKGDWDHPITFEGNGAGIRDIALSPSGDEVAAATDQAVVTWRRSTPRSPSARFLSRATPVSVRYSPDGTRLAAATGRSVITWEVRYPTHDPFVWIDNGVTNDPHVFVRFSPGGEAMITSGWNTNLLSFQEVMHGACQLLWRNLSITEWNSYVGRDTRYQCSCTNLPPGPGAPESQCQP